MRSPLRTSDRKPRTIAPTEPSLQLYLSACRSRLRQQFLARGAALLGIGALSLTALFALMFVTLVPSSGWVLAARIILYLAVVASIGVLVWWPFSDAAVTRVVEVAAPEFDGRLSTWRDASARGDDSPMLALLTRETTAVAETRVPDEVIARKTIVLPATVASASAVALIVLLSSGNTPWQLAAQRLWTGDLFSAAAPRITVMPGDTVVPKGADVVVEAAAFGFVVSAMEMHAAFEQTDGWETAPMSRLKEDKYGFVFVGVSEQVDYYVSAQGLNSERHVIHVADLPRVTEVTLAYTYPEWTGLPVTERFNGDVAALTGTRVAVTATTDAPVESPLIVMNGEVQDADAQGLTTTGAFEVGEPGSWHIAVRHEGTLARISDTYYIDVVEDRPPEVAYSWPGHDREASAIEEVTLRFTAADDFGIEAATFNYSVNGAEWQEIALDAAAAANEEGDGAEQLLYLEDLEVRSAAGGEGRPLRAGDMISFYAEARDHTMDSRTALYFIDVRPFDRTYRENQASGQGQGQGGMEVVQRQREIVSATWNLINKRDKDDSDVDQAAVLALLQRTLKDQVLTVVQRASARRLTLDAEVDTFATEMQLAADLMEPAAEKLDANELQEAIAPEQQALQHLLAADASMSDVDVSTAQASMRGTAGRSLDELMDLEMDRERNRYEMPQRPNMGEGPDSEDEEWQRLEELARRQLGLAERQQSNDEESLASRWQQERLQRELEELLEQLENQRGQQNQQGQQGQQGQQSGNQQRLDNAIAELNRAREAIERSLDQQQGSPDASQEATEAMRRAAEQLRNNAIGNMDQRLARSNRQVENLLTDQRMIMDRLDEIQSDELDSSRAGLRRPMNNYAMQPYAERKRRMQEDLNDLTREISDTGDAMAGSETERVLDKALSELSNEQIDVLLTASAEAFEYGRPLYAIPAENRVEAALERLSDRLDQARRQLAESAGEAGDDSALSRVRSLQQQLARATAGNGAGGYDDRALESIIRAADTLEYRLGQELGESFELDTTLSREAYAERGTDAANNAQLVQMAQDRLDLIEATLLNLEAAPIRAQQPRDEGRDSAEAARYFRDLSRPQG